MCKRPMLKYFALIPNIYSFTSKTNKTTVDRPVFIEKPTYIEKHVPVAPVIAHTPAPYYESAHHGYLPHVEHYHH